MFCVLSQNLQQFSKKNVRILTLVPRCVFSKHIFQRATPLHIINTEGLITLNLLPVYGYGRSLSTDTKISTNH